MAFLSVMDVLNNKLSLETMSQQGWPQKPHPGLLEFESRGDNGGLGSELVLPNLCHWLGEEPQHQRGQDAVPHANCTGICAVMVSVTLSQTCSCCRSTNGSRILSHIKLKLCLSRSFWDKVGICSGRLKLVAQFSQCMHWTPKFHLEEYVMKKIIIN